MLAIDTNVIVRYIVRDDVRQSARARAVIDGTDVFVPTTVILETEWVLRSLYGFDVGDVAESIRVLAGQPTVSLEQPLVVQTALAWAEQGVDLADALHMAASRHCSSFASFDRDLAKAAKRANALDVQAP